MHFANAFKKVVNVYCHTLLKLREANKLQKLCKSIFGNFEKALRFNKFHT